MNKYIKQAKFLLDNNLACPDTDINELADCIKKLQEEKDEKEKISDSKIDYNDEIISIEDMGELETIDISVTGDNLFYCNGILTKNSWGLPAVCDWMAAIIQSPELFAALKYIFKNIKSRFDSNINQIVTCGVDYGKMTLKNLDKSEQEIPIVLKDKLKYQEEKENAFDFTN